MIVKSSNSGTVISIKLIIVTAVTIIFSKVYYYYSM